MDAREIICTQFFSIAFAGNKDGADHDKTHGQGRTFFSFAGKQPGFETANRAARKRMAFVTRDGPLRSATAADYGQYLPANTTELPSPTTKPERPRASPSRIPMSVLHQRAPALPVAEILQNPCVATPPRHPMPIPGPSPLPRPEMPFVSFRFVSLRFASSPRVYRSLPARPFLYALYTPHRKLTANPFHRAFSPRLQTCLSVH